MSQFRDISPVPYTESGTSSCKEYALTNKATNNKIYKTEIFKSTENSASKNKQNYVELSGDSEDK